MTKTGAMFWSGETLNERLAPLIEPYAPERVDCAAYTLSVGPEVYVSRNDQTADPTTVTVRKLAQGRCVHYPARPVRLPAHRRDYCRPRISFGMCRVGRRHESCSATWRKTHIDFGDRTSSRHELDEYG
jgi:hypothetical protein